jgi:hypothetical protein
MKKRKRERPEDAAKELLQELALLRSRVDDVTEQFSLGVKARIDEIRHAMAATGESPDAGHVLPEPRLVEKMIRRLRLLTGRQPKGRAKDLKRIQDLVTSLSEAVQSRE